MLAHKGQREMLESVVQRVQTVNLDPKVLKVIQVPKEKEAIEEKLERKVIKVIEAIKVKEVIREFKDL